MEQINPYEVLGVEHDADEKAIRRAYRNQAKSMHPDAGGDRAQWERVSTALAVLTDPERRKTFDDTGRIDEKEPDNDRAAALGLIDGKLAAIVNAHITANFSATTDPRKMDVPAAIAAALNKDVALLTSAMRAGTAVLKYLKDTARRFSIKNPADFPEGDPIARAFQAQIDQAEGQIRSMKRDVLRAEMAVKIVSGYAFEKDAADPSQMWRRFPTETWEDILR